MLATTLFFIIFTSQILLLSYLLPAKILQRARQVLSNYPPSSYPKLYLKPQTYYETWQHRYQIANHLILGIGVLLLCAMLVNEYIGVSAIKVEEQSIFLYGMLQILPIILMELFECRQFKQMRQSNTNSTRKAELQVRSLFNFISPMQVLLTIAIMLVAICFDFYWHDFNVNWQHDTVIRTIAIISCNLYFAAIIVWRLYGKKQDPYQANKDRLKTIAITIKSAMYVSIALSIFLLAKAAGDVFDLRAFEASFISLYLQFIILFAIGTMLKVFRIDDIDFSVYQSDQQHR